MHEQGKACCCFTFLGARRSNGKRSRSLVLEDDVQSVDETGDEAYGCLISSCHEEVWAGMQKTGGLTKNGQGDVDEQINTTSTLEEDTHGREDDGEDDLADIAIGRNLS